MTAVPMPAKMGKIFGGKEMRAIKNLGDIIPEIEVLQILAGQRLFVRHMVGETVESLAKIEQVEGSALLTFHTDAIVVVEGLSQNGLTAKHLRFARENLRRRGLHFAQVTMWPRLRRIGGNGVRFNVPGGLEYIVVYPNEIVVADYSMSGSHGWLIDREEIGGLLAENPLSGDQIIRLSKEFDDLEEEHKEFFTDESIRKNAIYVLESFSGDHWWTRITILWEKSQRTFGFNGMKVDNEKGDLVGAIASGDYEKYKSIPDGIVDVVYDKDYRWFGLFDHEPSSRQIAGFQKAKVEFMGGLDGMDVIHTESVSREEIIQYISSINRVLENREKATRIKRTLKREKK